MAWGGCYTCCGSRWKSQHRKIVPLSLCRKTYKYLGILETETIKQVEIKDKIQKEYCKRTRKLLETKLSSRNLIKGINSWAVLLVWYSGHFRKWTRDELKQMDPKTWKLMTMHQALHVDRLNVWRKERGRGLASIEDSVDASRQQFEDYIGKYEALLRLARILIRVLETREDLLSL